MPATEDLIRHLAANLRPVGRGAGWRRLAAGIALGTVASLVGILAWLGPPLQAVGSTGAAAFTMKLLYSVTLFAISFALVFVASRPGHQVGRRWIGLLAPVALVALTATIELAGAPPETRGQLWLGSTWQTCLLAIIAFSMPIFAGIVWALQRLAPTNLRLGGFLAGIAGGSAAAVLYALYCPETTAAFLLSWYSIGVLTAGLIGALVGPRLIRW